MIVKSEMINGKLYFLTEDGRIYKITDTVRDVVIQRLADVHPAERDMMFQPTFLKFVDRFNG